MPNPYERLARCVGFEWDRGNATKNWDKHDVSQGECEQAFFNRPLLVKHDAGHSLAESRLYALGRTDENRFLFVAFTMRNDLIRVISARNMTPAERRRYPL